MKSKYLQTLISQLISLILAISALKLAATIFDPADFGLYNLVKRIIAMISYPLLVGLGISIPIYVAEAYLSITAQARLITVALFWWLFLTLILALINLIVPDLFTEWVLGEGYEYLSWPFVLGFSGLYLYTILYASYRGEQNFGRANLFQILASGLFPLVAIFLSGGVVGRFFYILAFLMFVANFIVLLDLFNRNLLLKISKQEIGAISKKYLKFGLPRIPGEFALFGLMSSPLFFVARYESLELAGQVAVGYTIVQLIASFYEFIGTLILPKSAQLISDGRYQELNRLVQKLSIYSFLSAFLLCLFIFNNIEFLFELLDKNKFVDNIIYSRVIIICVPFYIVYLIIRNPQDALSIKPFNSYILSACFLLQLVLLLLAVNIDLAYWKVSLYHLALTIPYITLGLVTLLSWNHQIKKHLG